MALPPIPRRNFLLTCLSTAGGIIAAARCTQSQNQTGDRAAEAARTAARESPTAPPLDPSDLANRRNALPQRVLGKVGDTLPVLGLGGSASPLSRSGAETEAIAIIERALQLGVRYFDTAANYGPSEERLGRVLPPVRDQVFIATKTSRRDRDSAWRQLEQSLQRLKTDVIDLWQFHALTHDWDLDTILDERQGAIKAAQEAHEQGIVRAIGVTGHHNPAIIARALEAYPFDTALVPINAADRHTAAPFIEGVLPVAQRQNVGIIAMKVPAYGRLLKPGALTGMAEAMGYALSQAGVHLCIIAADDLAQLEENVQVAQQFQPFNTETLADIEARTANVWRESSFFRSWG